MHHQCHCRRACRRSPGNGESGAHVQRHTLLDESRGSGCLRSEEHTSELQSRLHLVCRLLLEKKKNPKPLTRARQAPEGPQPCSAQTSATATPCCRATCRETSHPLASTPQIQCADRGRTEYSH